MDEIKCGSQLDVNHEIFIRRIFAVMFVYYSVLHLLDFNLCALVVNVKVVKISNGAIYGSFSGIISNNRVTYQA